MKFIGQYIQQLIARFRNDVYLEDVSTGTIASGGNLGLDSNNKIVKATVSGCGGIASAIDVADESSDTTCFPTFVTAATGAQTLKTGSNLTFNSSTGQLDAAIFNGTNVTAAGTVTGGTGGIFTGLITLQNTSNDANGPILNIKNTKSGNAGADDDECGEIRFLSRNTAGTPEEVIYSEIISTIAESDDSDERGKLELQVANDGTLRNGITMTGTDTAEEVDVTIANGASSLTTIAGDLQVNGNEIKDEDGFTCITFDSSGNTIIGTLDGDNGGDLIANRVLVKDTDESPTAQLALVDNDDNNICQLARIGGGANAHKGQLVLRDNATAKVQIKASGSSYINASSAKLGIGNNSPTKELDVTGDTAISGDLTVGGDATISGDLKVIADIKILPRDFIADDVGRPLMIDDTGSDRFLESHSTAKMYASINIPTGLKATQLTIYGSGTSAITVYEADVTSKSVTSKGTGNIGTLLNFTDVTGDSSNYLLIELAQASGEEVYGGKVTIA